MLTYFALQHALEQGYTEFDFHGSLSPRKSNSVYPCSKACCSAKYVSILNGEHLANSGSYPVLSRNSRFSYTAANEVAMRRPPTERKSRRNQGHSCARSVMSV